MIELIFKGAVLALTAERLFDYMGDFFAWVKKRRRAKKSGAAVGKDELRQLIREEVGAAFYEEEKG